ncbi:MAG: DUF4392 domain-containing protein [Chloroflexi bacterium]|nr:DUF4392 domain-containing protein [Chloroflexota bacterium]
MQLADNIRKVGASIDQLISIDITGRGIIGALYQAARAKQGDPLSLLAAERLADVVGQGDTVIIATGMPTLPWRAPEQDGPIGAATLARSLVLGLGAKPIIVIEEDFVELAKATVRSAGLYTFGLDRLLELPTTASVVPFPIGIGEAKRVGSHLLETYRPKALITIEKAGRNENGGWHTATGGAYTEWTSKVDDMFLEAKARGILTIGIGDGGNELGCGMIKEAVIEHVPGAAKCQCPCGGSIVPQFVPDVLIMAAISNWGAYGIEACLASILGRMEVLHDSQMELRVQRECADAGANNDGPGLLDPGADAVPPHIHAALIDIMGFVVKSGADPGRLYRVPRYPWLA